MGLIRAPSRPESLPIEFTLNVTGANLPEIWREYLGWSALVEAVAS
jgi:hypothetical protein